MQEFQYFQFKNCFEENSHVTTNLILGEIKERPTPIFSIVIPTYKRDKLLRESIESALNQTFKLDFEIVIIDDDAHSATKNPIEEMINAFNSNKIYYYRNEKNLGQHGNWNRCFEKAKGEWVCMLHDDDKLSPNYLDDYYNLIKKIKNIGFISCRLDFLIHNNTSKSNKPENIKFKKRLRNIIDGLLPNYSKINSIDYLFGFNTYIVGSCIKRSLALKIGGFNSQFFPSSDYYYAVKFQNTFNMTYFLKNKNYTYRILENESLNISTFKKFITNDFHFTKFYIKNKNYKCSRLLFFLTYQYTIQRVNTGGEIYNIKLDSSEIFNELNINSFQNNIATRFFGSLLLKILSYYRIIFKY